MGEAEVPLVTFAKHLNPLPSGKAIHDVLHTTNVQGVKISTIASTETVCKFVLEVSQDDQVI